MRLQLNIFMMHGNMAGMTLKREGQQFKVAQLCNALQFVATMEQHRIAIASGGGHELCYDLRDSKGNEWVLSYRCGNRMVLLEVWVQHPGSQDNLHTVFSWEGSVGEFDKAIRKFSALLSGCITSSFARRTLCPLKDTEF
ncbi:hypothetical protein [Pedobacter psychroterrae]|uniref:Uncharacterized protein n=1 Tax=Pedobacter psychroterrae TaxID=2530453 RepID=A0A4R0NSL5_9SPHI|nr:hypothetical protein [Pedobacter psychroterrae]TCD03129.1 hypothetical protein EZ437_03895 [Pedobacter psychroterrae]